MMTEAEKAEFLRRVEEFERPRGMEPALRLGPAGEDPSVSSRDTFGIEAQARAEWKRSPAIRAEFVELERYVAFCRADAKGLVKILSRSRNA